MMCEYEFWTYNTENIGGICVKRFAIFRKIETYSRYYRDEFRPCFCVLANSKRFFYAEMVLPKLYMTEYNKTVNIM